MCRGLYIVGPIRGDGGEEVWGGLLYHVALTIFLRYGVRPVCQEIYYIAAGTESYKNQRRIQGSHFTALESIGEAGRMKSKEYIYFFLVFLFSQE